MSSLLFQENEAEISSQQMEIEGTESPHHSTEDLSFVSSQEDQFKKAHRYSMSDTLFSDDDEVSNQDNLQTYYISQDTGYNTNSLQLTNNQETGPHSAMTTQNETSLHTNLTHQFGSLPFSSQDGHSVDCSAVAFVKEPTKKAFVRHLAPKSVMNGQRSSSDGVGVGDGVVLNEREVRHRAKRILGKSISMDDSQLGASLDTSKLRPYLLNAIGVPAFVMSSPKSSYGKQYVTDERILPSK